LSPCQRLCTAKPVAGDALFLFFALVTYAVMMSSYQLRLTMEERSRQGFRYSERSQTCWDPFLALPLCRSMQRVGSLLA
jgi:hypothetical protein